jgi:hypothetical protein
MRHIISGCSLHLPSLTDRELADAIKNHQLRLGLIDNELGLLVSEQVRRQLGVVRPQEDAPVVPVLYAITDLGPIHSTPPLF